LNAVIAGFFMYVGLFAKPARFVGQRWGLLRNVAKLVWLAPQFLFTRRRSAVHFPFRMWDYALARAGAFYRYVQPSTAENLPLVSVIVRTMPGRSGKLTEALASLLAQTYAHIELVLVEDGGSTAQEKVKGLKSTSRFANIIYLPLPKSGRCVAGNAALQAATGQLVCFLDDDDLLYAEHIEVLTQEWIKNPTLGAVYGLAYQVRTRIISHEPWEYQDVEHSLIYQQSFNRALLWHHNYLPIQTVLFQRSLYLQYGGFDTDLDNLEDWNLWVRYSLENDFLMVPKVTSLYRVPAVAQLATDRQHVLDDYYAKAQDKHALLRVTLSPPQVLKIAESLSRELFVAGIPVSRLRNWVLSNRLLRRMYHPLRKVVHLMRRIRQG
jgi:glycosyltransferase involved in cell wall biosynthesis